MNLSPEQMEDMAERAADKAIRKVFAGLGVDTGNPFEMQKDFAHLRKWRTSVDMVVPVSLKTAIGVIVAGALAALYAFVIHPGK